MLINIHSTYGILKQESAFKKHMLHQDMLHIENQINSFGENV